MTITELPFWALLIFTLLPITLGVIMAFRIVSLTKELIAVRKTGSLVDDFGKMILIFIFFSVIVATTLYVVGEQPSGFDLFEYLMEDMLPLTWYALFVYGITVNLALLFAKAKQRGG